MQTKKYLNLVFLLLVFFYQPVVSPESVWETPSKGVVNLPVAWQNGKLQLNLPSGPASKKPRTVAACLLDNLSVQVLKTNKRLTAKISEEKNGQVTEREFYFVVSETIRKEMLGQYQVAVDIAQQLGLTEVDSVKIWLVDIKDYETKTLIFFYDTDNEIIDRTILIGRDWQRCNEPVVVCGSPTPAE